MATQTFHTHVSPAATAAGAGLLARLGSAAAFVGRTLALASGTQARVDEIRRLQALSDAQLAERGLARHEIVHHVYRDLFHD